MFPSKTEVKIYLTADWLDKAWIWSGARWLGFFFIRKLQWQALTPVSQHMAAALGGVCTSTTSSQRSDDPWQKSLFGSRHILMDVRNGFICSNITMRSCRAAGWGQLKIKKMCGVNQLTFPWLIRNKNMVTVSAIHLHYESIIQGDKRQSLVPEVIHTHLMHTTGLRLLPSAILHFLLLLLLFSVLSDCSFLALVHHVSLHRDVFFYTLNDDTHQSRADSCIKPAANMQRPAVWNLLTPPIAAYRRNQSATRPPPRIYLLSQHTSLLFSPANLE